MFKIGEKRKKIVSLLMTAIISISFIAPVYFQNANIVSGDHTPNHFGITGGPSQTETMRPAEPSDDCGITNLKACGKLLIAKIGGMFLYFGGLILGITGLLLDEVIKLTVVEMSKNLAPAFDPETGGIYKAWSTFRDLANMFFIFIILYIAIMTILRMDTSETKKLLVHVVIIALLLNFSLFFTKVAIDVSNIAALAFHERVSQGGIITDLDGKDLGLAGAIMKHLNLTSIFNPGSALSSIDHKKPLDQIFVTGIFGFALFLVASVVFLAAALMFMIRYLVLIILMILSPLAFVAMAFPKDEWSQKWWRALFSQAIFAPAFFMIIFASIQVMEAIPLVGKDVDSQAGFANLAATAAGQLPEASTMSIVMNYIIVIGLLIFSLIVAKEVGVQGANGSIKFARKAVGAATVPLRNMGYATARQGLQITARPLYDKLKQTRFGQSRIFNAPLEATLGRLSKAKIGSKSVEQAHKEDLQRKSALTAINHKRMIMKELKELEKAPEKNAEEIQRLKDELEQVDMQFKRITYTKDEWEKERAIQKQKRELAKRMEELNRRRQKSGKGGGEKKGGGSSSENSSGQTQTQQQETQQQETAQQPQQSEENTRVVPGDSMSIEEARQEGEQRQALIQTGRFTEEEVRNMTLEQVQEALSPQEPNK